ncbi:MAG: RidA family protein [Dehalococcoidia bacterium]|nr:RidA family protein [Dehalococcoidia bacterium]
MARDILKVPRLGKPIGSYSYGARVKGGTLLLMAGVVPIDDNGKLVGKGDLQKQIAQVVHNLKVDLEAAGARLEDVVQMHTYTTDMDGMVKLSKWRCDNFPELWGKEPGDETAAPSTLIGIKRLGWPEFKLEIEVVAHVP